VLFAAALLLASACASEELETSRVLFLDGATQASTEPLDLEATAVAQGCDPHTPWMFVQLTVEDIVTPHEYIVSGRYGLERVRPRLAGATVARLQQLAGREDEVVARLSTALVGRQLLEPSSDFSPSASTDGLRLVRLMSTDGELLNPMLDDVLDELRSELGPAANGSEEAPLDLARVPHDDQSLALRVQRAVDAAERSSDFRAPGDLSVRWISFDHPPWLSPTLMDAWRRTSEPCLGSKDASPIESFEWGVGVSLPGGAIFVDRRVDWRELELHYALLHELMHQHQYALCAGGARLGDVPVIVREAHASSLAFEILRASGADPAAFDFAVSWDAYSAAVQAFDALRAGLGLSPDEYLLHLVEHPDDAERLSRQIKFEMWCPGHDSPAGAGPLVFEIVGRSTPDQEYVAISNPSDRPFSGYANGWWWHCENDTATNARCIGGTPFTLLLPARGRIVLELHLGEGDDAWHPLYRETLAPVIER